MDRLQALLDEGLDLQRRGSLAEAIARYDEALRADPGSVDAAYYRAAAECQAGNLARGIEAARRVLTLDPRHARATNLIGKAQLAMGARAEALASFNRAIALNPDFASAHASRASLLVELGEFGEALTSLDQALALDPLSIAPSAAAAFVTRATIRLKVGRAADALADLDQAGGEGTDALVLRGIALGKLRRHADALACFDQVLLREPNSMQAILNRGTALSELGRHDEAVRAFDAAIALKPESAAAHRGRGAALVSLRRFSEALSSLERSVQLAPADAPALCDRGLALIELGRHDEALVSLDRALAIDANFAAALTNRGLALADTRQHTEALKYYRRAQSIDPEFPQAHWFEAEALLRCGDYPDGWRKYEWRRKQNGSGLEARDLAVGMWDGGELRPGTRILLHAEQGLGDTIQFARYVPEVARRGASVIFEVQGALKTLAQCLRGVSVVGRGETLPPFDLHCPLLSLPLAFNTTLENIPATVPYLSAPPDRLDAWRDCFADFRIPKIGVAWSGNASFGRDHHRSMTLAQFRPVLDTPGMAFVRLNPAISPEDHAMFASHFGMFELKRRIGDFADTAAIVAHLDLVITTDTSIAHLAGALGKPVWILLSHIADWRWLLDRSDSPWYPTARLFRQSRLGDWGSVTWTVREELLARFAPPMDR